MDARKFVLGNVGPIGCIPYQKTINQLSSDQCVDLANQLAHQYNSRLQDLLTELNENLREATFVNANVYDLVMELITNYDKYGKVHYKSIFFYLRGSVQLQPCLSKGVNF